MYLACARLCIHKLHSENPLDIRGGILTPSNLIRNNVTPPCRRIFRTDQEDSQTALCIQQHATQYAIYFTVGLQL